MSHFGNEPDPFEGVPDVDERICDWVDGTMPARDRERFEAELRVNPQLRQQVDEYEAMVADIRDALQQPIEDVELADRVMATLASQATGSTPRGRSVWPFVWALTSAAALLAIAVGINHWGGQGPVAKETDAASHEQPRPEPNVQPVRKSVREMLEGNAEGQLNLLSGAEDTDGEGDDRVRRLETAKLEQQRSGEPATAGLAQPETAAKAPTVPVPAEGLRPRDQQQAVTLEHLEETAEVGEISKSGTPPVESEGAAVRKEAKAADSKVARSHTLDSSKLEDNKPLVQQSTADEPRESTSGENKPGEKWAGGEARARRVGRPDPKPSAPTGPSAPAPAGPATGGPSTGGPAGPAGGGPGANSSVRGAGTVPGAPAPRVRGGARGASDTDKAARGRRKDVPKSAPSDLLADETLGRSVQLFAAVTFEIPADALPEREVMQRAEEVEQGGRKGAETEIETETEKLTKLKKKGPTPKSDAFALGSTRKADEAALLTWFRREAERAHGVERLLEREVNDRDGKAARLLVADELTIGGLRLVRVPTTTVSGSGGGGGKPPVDRDWIVEGTRAQLMAMLKTLQKEAPKPPQNGELRVPVPAAPKLGLGGGAGGALGGRSRPGESSSKPDGKSQPKPKKKPEPTERIVLRIRARR